MDGETIKTEAPYCEVKVGGRMLYKPLHICCKGCAHNFTLFEKILRILIDPFSELKSDAFVRFEKNFLFCFLDNVSPFYLTMYLNLHGWHFWITFDEGHRPKWGYTDDIHSRFLPTRRR